MELQIIASIEIDFPEGKKEIKMELKDKEEITNCEIDKILVIALINGDQYTGYFKGINDETIMLESLSKKNTIGLEIHWVQGYFEQIIEKGE